MTTTRGTDEEQGQARFAPAWAVDRGAGRWGVEWEVPGATRYELYQVPDGSEEDGEMAAVAKGASAEELAFTAAAELGAGHYAVAAYSDGAIVPLRVSAVGVGERSGKADISKRLREWQQWSQLAPHKKNAKSKVGDPDVSRVKGVKRTKQSYTLTKNPNEVVTFNPNVNLCFPGAIVQARPAMRNGYLISAQIEDSDRADLGVTVDRLTGKKETASPPSASNVTAAIGKVVGEDTPGSSDIVYRRVEAYSSAEAALELGISATYGGFSASLDVEAKRKETQNTVLVYLRERAFTAFCDTSTPAALFKDSFTEEKLTQLITNGAMGHDNPPLLVNSVSYGRILTFTFTAKTSEAEINATLKASYSGFANVSASAKARYKEVINQSEVASSGYRSLPTWSRGS
ncbi:thiol-activated cytolysin family protein [Streptomyces sp. IBSNAI002]|uniref:thiol-activated cytolysin family protein n=1 Tax=Streptomyces sp. IBSNAI002 TaxID=3457500 RepID=UPI003FD02E05